MRYSSRLTGLCLVALLMPQLAVYAQENTELYSQAELDQMLAPVALYPDSVLAQMLIAATYPLEIIEAAGWSRSNPDLKGDTAVAAVEDMDWDPSVKAMVAFPNIIDRMERDLDWTTHLGDAFLRQEEQVMVTIQELRERAYAAGNLESSENIRVYREPEIIIIEPVHPRVVYVPYYDPWTVYGHWWWPAYPPVRWAYPAGYHYHHHTAFYWGSGINFSLGFFYSNFDWHHRHIVVHKHYERPYRHHYKSGKPFYKYAGYDKHYRKWQHNDSRRHRMTHRRHDDLRGKHKTRSSFLATRHDDRGKRKTLKPGYVHPDKGRFSRRDAISRPIIRNHADRFHDERRATQERYVRKHHDARRFSTHNTRSHRPEVDRVREELERNRNTVKRLIQRNRPTTNTIDRAHSTRKRAIAGTHSRHRDPDQHRRSGNSQAGFQSNHTGKMNVRPFHTRRHSGAEASRSHDIPRHQGSISHKTHRPPNGARSSFGKGQSHGFKGGRSSLQAPVSGNAFGRR